MHLAVPLDIKGKKSIVEALDSMVKEEILENPYYIEEFKKKVTVSKRYYIKKLPNTVILHLKRFEYNFAIGNKKKINDYCEFPLKINFFPWTAEGNALKVTSPKTTIYHDGPPEFDYELTGIVVHRGTADGGHYYSYIKERDRRNSINFNKWFEFNDTTVRPFKLDELSKECFGSSSVKYANSEYGGNAYLVIYQKCGTSSEVIMHEKAALEKYIEMENTNFLNATIYLNPDYAKFIRSFIKLWNINESNLKFSEEESKPTAIEILEKINEGQEGETINLPYALGKLNIMYAQDLIKKMKDTQSVILFY